MHIAEREIQLPDAVIGKLLKVAAEDKSVLSLGPGEPDFPLPAPLVEFTKQYADQCNHYSPPGGRKELKEAIVKKLQKENGITTRADHVIVTAGSQEALLLATASSCDVSEQVIVPNPSYLGYVPMFELLDAFPVPLPLYESNDWAVNPDDLKKLIDPRKTKVILLNSPANPTGTVLSRKILEEIADIAVQHNLYIFSDEAYEKLTYNKPHISIGSLNGMENYAVTFQTFSKSYAMCGHRVGYAVGPKLLIDAMTKAHVYAAGSAPTIGQMVATKALTMDPKYVEAMRKEYDKRRKYIVKRLNNMGLPTVNPQGAFYTFSNIKHLSDDSFKFAFHLLKEAKVAVVPGKEFGVYGEGYIRCSYATALPKIETAMDRMEKFVNKYKK